MALHTPEGYRAFTPDSLRPWLASLPALAARLGGSPQQWQISEVGDGNLNLVFLVDGTDGGVCVKQSLPYVRVVGESWPMPLERAWFEYQHAVVAGPHLAGLIPAPLHYDATLFASVVALLRPHRVLRGELLAGQRYPQAASAVAEFVARSAVHTSPLAQPLEAVAGQVAGFAANLALTRVTAELVFADPFEALPRNRWTSPQLDDTVAALRANAPLRAAVAELGHRFLTRREALLHGDLHTGSVMVSADDTRVIDAEFALYGPVGFDTGVFVANLLMAYFAQPGYSDSDAAHSGYADWLLEQVAVFWQHFARRYDALWAAHASGDAWPQRLFADADGQAAFAAGRARRLADIYQDTLGFAGAEIVRRITGFAHNADFERIADPALRARCEQAALALASELLLQPQAFGHIGAVLARAQAQADHHTATLEAAA
ncbi:S-methyl-5-thioribose kinase [Vogesella sp. DC21W]|uniref:S-methyl-5-thioribose kinase n=1 Tax=Vogesella aquatica TaxID=2984206 RepID=A0ABT5J149_9NEIS|nr:S-methyl-5-thioribose kinase [Vogesella aquatica]MDC7718575.1 S-methyl-5-thioribose kinase [Vogesella aquatica]